ncbi:MAG: YkgJ family cysteine cluster protein [Candidatus Eisenbacteria bacterium]|nr:YkgJ family cysteine cluster protein [Candidatus Eisenbacteria bacterium]
MIDKRTVHFSCTRCGRCCREPGYVFFSPSDRRRGARHLGISVRAFKQQYGGDEAGTEIRVTRRRQCPFFSEEGCAIHPAHPEQCRTFPFWPEIVESKDAWNRRSRRCPGMGRIG